MSEDEQSVTEMIDLIKRLCDCQECKDKRHRIAQALMDNVIENITHGTGFQKEQL